MVLIKPLHLLSTNVLRQSEAMNVTKNNNFVIDKNIDALSDKSLSSSITLELTFTQISDAIALPPTFKFKLVSSKFIAPEMSHLYPALISLLLNICSVLRQNCIKE